MNCIREEWVRSGSAGLAMADYEAAFNVTYDVQILVAPVQLSALASADFGITLKQ